MKIYKLVLLTTLFLLGLISSKANAQSPLPIHIGIKGGANYSELPVSDGFSSKYASGYFGGAMARFDIGRFYIQNEILYSEKSSKIETSLMGSRNVKWKSIEVPLVIGYKVVNLDALNVRVFGGGVYSYVIDDNITSLNQLKDSYKKFDKSNIGYQVGAGVEMWKFTLDFTYQGGLNNISKDFDSKVSSFNVSIGYFIL
ncbi:MULTISPECIES: porin family protein [unclassified Flavobacterium]|uniref:porin family protein n=1 Tax=unclassified Flavobacterium TaxID=196869 RepID=UPI000A3D6F87|nr:MULTISPECIES: porin family protein [unclassified Flavobacterium]MEA9411737.1 porin family protein [Flavobacterium sp. PL02]